MHLQVNVSFTTLLLLGVFHEGLAAASPLVRKNDATEIYGDVDNERYLATTLTKVNNHKSKLNACEGHCNNEDDCAGNLKCFQRSGNQAVPGCSGVKAALKGVDFCYDPSATSNSGVKSKSSHSFLLKLYWEKGYYWQAETFERKWCVECVGKCVAGNQVDLQACEDVNTRFEFIGDSETVQVKVANTNLCFELTGPREIQLEKCNSSNSKQKFNSGRGSFSGSKFEFIPITDKGGCLTQSHEPKPGEVVFRDGCDVARYWNTSYWNKHQ